MLAASPEGSRICRGLRRGSEKGSEDCLVASGARCPSSSASGNFSSLDMPAREASIAQRARASAVTTGLGLLDLPRLFNRVAGVKFAADPLAESYWSPGRLALLCSTESSLLDCKSLIIVASGLFFGVELVLESKFDCSPNVA